MWACQQWFNKPCKFTLTIVIGVACNMIWTGGWSPTPTEEDSWNWYYSNDFNGTADHVRFHAWGRDQPNNRRGKQNALLLHRNKDFNFNDLSMENSKSCFLCECP